MFDEINKKIEKVNKVIGIDMPLPKLTKKRLLLSSKTNFIAGSSLLVIGAVTASKWSLAIGGIAIVSGVFMANEAKKR